MTINITKNIEAIYVGLGISFANEKNAFQHLRAAKTIQITDEVYKYRTQLAKGEKSAKVLKKMNGRFEEMKESSSLLRRIGNMIRNIFAGRGFNTDKQYVHFVIEELSLKVRKVKEMSTKELKFKKTSKVL